VLKESGGNIDELLTVDEVKTLLVHFPNQFREIGLLGGEPFLYPYLGEMLELLWQNNIMPKIFTSATNVLPECLQNIDVLKNPVSFIVNIGTRDSYNEEKYKNLDDFFKKFHISSSLSYTILDLDADTTFLFDVIDEYKLMTRSIRVGVALPIYNGGNQYVKREDYKKLGEFFINFAEKSSARSVILGMDCGFVACMFTPTQIGTLQRCGVRFSFACGAALDIGPKLKVWNCFPLFQLHQENALEAKNVNKLVWKFNKQTDKYFNNQTGIFAECAECKYFKRHVCEGGCKSFKSVGL
jgi:radical SAM protein with 4Fe4S-binding SPASM domain